MHYLERRESGRVSYFTWGRTYPALLIKTGVTPVSGVKCDHRDGVPFAISALTRVQALIDDHSAYVDREIDAWIDDIFSEVPLADLLKRTKETLRQHEWERDRLLGGGLASRPARKMPSLIKVATYHGLEEKPFCVRCGYEPEGATWRAVRGELQKAHVIDRVFGGLDSVANLLPLCVYCHKCQPIFEPGDELRAFAWFFG